MAIRAIIFDCFGVLVSGSLEQFIDKYLSQDQRLISRAHEINDQASLGLISYEDQVKNFASMANISVSKVHEEMDTNTRNAQLLKYISQSLKGKYKIGFLSNASANWLNELFTADDISLFDDFVLSCEVHLVKPDTRIYELAASRLDAQPQECIFIDDIERYCTAARDVGMQAIEYKNFPTFKKQLEGIIKLSS